MRRTSADVQGRPQASAGVRVPHTLPANDPEVLRTMDAIAEEFGFKDTRAARQWCKRRGVPYWPDGGYSWVDRNAVVAAIKRRTPVVVPPASSASVAAWVDSTLPGGKARG